MDNLSAPAKPSPEAPFRHPLLEFGRGMATFSLVFAVFTMVQMVVLIQQVLSRTPALQGQGFSMAILENEAFLEGSRALTENGDTVALISLLAGAIGTLVLWLLVRAWKKGHAAAFLGLTKPRPKSLLMWTGLFIAFYLVLELVLYLLPDMESAFMRKMLSSVTNYPLLFLGVAIMPAIFEELLLRGLLYGSLRYLMDKHAAIALTAGLFALVHPQYEWYVQLLYVLPMGVFLGYARANSGSIWTGVLLHLLNNCASIVIPQ